MVKENKSACSGCSACQNACPTAAITMEPDAEGFAYPVIDPQKCVSCGLCREVCPFDAEYQKKCGRIGENFAQTYYGGCVEAVQVRQNSRSGGIFYALARQILAQGGVVYGVALDGALRAVLTRVESEDSLPSLQGSKYVQADMEDGFSRIRQDLAENRRVFFAGTACQCAGLKSFLAQSGCGAEKLYTADLVCHGVPSPKIWQDNLKDLARKWGAAPVEANFRDKALGWRSHIESYRCRNADGSLSNKKYSNRYTTLFYSGVMLRPSCHNCPFCNFNRQADLTLGDFWGHADAGVEIDKALGVSQILVNTGKGAELLGLLTDVRLYPVSRESVSRQPNLFHPTAASPERDKFWALYRQKGYAAASKQFFPWIERVKLPYNLLKKTWKGIRKAK